MKNQGVEKMSNFAAQVVETARALGMDPLDLATIISYETGGTFDPAKRGPTTQWGQHRGLIQFGEPQARQYGVDWSDPVGSQLGANGAIARYFRNNGYQPGMGLLDAYSIVNAGGPGRYGASDANNGGAPGTVADKVNNQMAGHRANALKLLGIDGPATQADIDAVPYNIGVPAEDTAASPWEQASGLLAAFMQQQQQAPVAQIQPRQVAQYTPQRRDNSAILQFLASLR